jgi:hypothetical protein
VITRARAGLGSQPAIAERELLAWDRRRADGFGVTLTGEASGRKPRGHEWVCPATSETQYDLIGVARDDVVNVIIGG